jgi:hypothetical protein
MRVANGKRIKIEIARQAPDGKSRYEWPLISEKIVSQQCVGGRLMETNPGQVTELLKAMGEGDEKTADALLPLAYGTSPSCQDIHAA